MMMNTRIRIEKRIKRLITLIGILVISANSVKAVPIGNDVEYIPPPRRLGIQIINPSSSAKLHVNGSVLIADGSQSDGFVLSSDADGLATWTDINSLITQVNSLNVNGSIFAPLINGSTIISQTFLGGNYFGNGAGLTNINANNISGTINGNNIDPNFRPSALKAPDGSPDPALSVDNEGSVGINTTSPLAKLHVRGFGANVTRFGNVANTSSTWSHVFGLQNRGGIMTVREGGDTANAPDRRHVIYSHEQGAYIAIYDNGGSQDIRLSTITGATSYFLDNNVGISTTDAKAKLEVRGGGANITRFGNVSDDSTFGHVFGLQNRGGIMTVKEGGSTLVPEDRRHVIYSNNQGAYIGVYDNGGIQDIRISALENGNTFFLSNNVGIGTKLPNEKLQVVGNVRADKFIGEVDATNITGTVNVNNIDPNFRPTALKAPGGGPNPAVHVGNEGIVTLLYHQDALPAEPGLIPSLVINNSSTNNNTAVGIRFNSNVFAGATAGIVGRAENSDRMSLDFYTEGPAEGRTTKMSIDTAGNVGIGTGINDPAAKLEVNGNILIRKDLIVNNVSPAPAFSGTHGHSYAAISVNPTIFLSETDVNDKNYDIQVNGGDFKLFQVDDARSQPFTERLVIKADTGNLGLGVVAPTERLEVAGNIKANKFIGEIDATSIVGNLADVVDIDDLGDAKTLIQSVFLGDGAGNSVTTTGSRRSATGVGVNSLNSLTTGLYNTAIGYNTLSQTTTSHGNTAVGYTALQYQTGGGNTAVGSQAMGNSACVGTNCGGLHNTAVGTTALYQNTTGNNNTALGHTSLRRNSTGSDNTAVGFYSSNYNINGDQNVGVGNYTLQFQETGNGNVALGFMAARGNTSTGIDFSRNTIIGFEAGKDIRDGANDNILIGYRAAHQGISGSNNIIIGVNNFPQSFSASNQLDIADTIYGNLATKNIGINESNPQRALHISDVMRLSPRTTAPSNPAIGDVYVDTSGAFCFYNGSSWKNLINGGSDTACQ